MFGVLLFQKIIVVIEEFVELIYIGFLLLCTHLLFYFLNLIIL